MTDYPIVICRTPGDVPDVPDVPDRPGCNAQGETLEEAPREVQSAKAGWLEAARELGRPIPDAVDGPDIFWAR